MKKYITYTKLYALLALGIMITACEDFLVEEPVTEITELDFFADEEGARLAANAMYDPLNYGESSILGAGGHSYEFLIGDICTDDSEKGSTDGDQPGISNLKNFTANGGTSNINSLWNKHFIAIGRANLVLKNLEAAPLSTEVKEELAGEARFIRGYCYFTLVRIFGGVPLFDEPVTPDQINQRSFDRAAIYEVYAQVDADFRYAMDHLPEKGVREVGRANKGAAAAFLARSIMYQLGTDNTNDHSWTEVLALTDQFIAGDYGTYALAANYATLFETEGENNEESIFEIQAVDTGLPPFNQGPYVGSAWSVFQHPQDMGGWGFNTPTSDLADVFEANDPRRPATAIAIGEHAYGIEMVASTRNKTGFYHRKAILPPDEWETEKGSGYNIRKFRYADILLMNAEAAYHTGNPAQAVARLTAIRNRASQSTFPKGYDPAAPMEYTATGYGALDNTGIPTGGQPLLDYIYLERRRELGMEQLRFWDLVRTGRYVSTMEAKYSVGNQAQEHAITSSTKESPDQVVVNPIVLFPIPALEVANWDILQNRNY